MKISVVIPVYNVEKYLSRCIDSVLNQTYSNIEVILVNDGSTDKSAEVCEKYVDLDSRVILINQKNKGLPGARNSGLKIAKGQYIGFIDSDDVIDSDMVLHFKEIATKFSPDVIVSNIFQYEYGNKKFQYLRNELPYDTILEKNEIKKFFLEPYYGGYLGIIPSSCTKMYNMTFLKDYDLIFDESLKRAEDYWFNFEVFKNASSVYAIDKAFYHYFKNDESIMHTFREGEFAIFLDSRAKLLEKNNELGFKINLEKYDKKFIDVTNEFVLSALKNKRSDLVFSILKNKVFSNAFKNVKPDRYHTKIIQKLLKFRMINAAFLVYKIWATKIK